MSRPGSEPSFVHHTSCTYYLPTAPQADTIAKSSPWKGQTNTPGRDRKRRVSMICFLTLEWPQPCSFIHRSRESHSKKTVEFKPSRHRNGQSGVQGGQGPAQGHPVPWCTACSSLSVPTGCPVPFQVPNQCELWRLARGLKEFGNGLEFKARLRPGLAWRFWQVASPSASISLALKSK